MEMSFDNVLNHILKDDDSVMFQNDDFSVDVVIENNIRNNVGIFPKLPCVDGVERAYEPSV